MFSNNEKDSISEPLQSLSGTNNDKHINIKRCSIKDDIEILGHVFHGLKDIKKYVEMSLYINYSHGKADVCEPELACDVHVGEIWMPYPRFDSYDDMNEFRSYQNFIFRRSPITQDEMREFSKLPSKGNACKLDENVPAEMLPMAYYYGDGDTMLVATM